MTQLVLTVFAKSPDQEKAWARELTQALQGQVEATVQPGHAAEAPGQVLFFDAEDPELVKRLAAVDRAGRAIFLITRDGAATPAALLNGQVDDVLVAPFRRLEALSKVRHYQQILLWDEVDRLNSSFAELVNGLRDDLQLAERLQKAKLPSRFSDVRGFNVKQRYLAGLRPGGDHFDIAEARDGQQFSFVMTDSSSYGLSSAVISVLMSVTMKLSSDEVRSCRETLARIHHELRATLRPNDRLSLFYCRVNRRDLKLQYFNLGSGMAFHAPPKAGFEPLPSHGDRLSSTSRMPEGKEGEVALLPESRLVVVSDGFLDAVGGEGKMRDLLNERRAKEPADSLNELTYRIKSKFKDEDDVPEQDCTAVCFDVDPRAMRVV